MHRFVGVFRLWSGCRLLGVTLLAGACAHGEPFDFTNPGNQVPFDPTPPVRLTLDVREDQFAAWLPDGSGLVYSYFPGRDGCLAELPPTGGQIRRSRCYRAAGSEDSTDLLTAPSPRSRDELAWVEQHSFSNRVVPDYGAIMLGSLRPDQPATRLVRLPYTASSGHVHATALDLRWLPGNRLAYIGADVSVARACNGCKLDTIVTPQDIVLLDLAGGAPTVMPNSSGITSIWPTADSAGLYYTELGDTRVWQRNLAGGAPAVVHDFGLEVSGVSVAGDRLAVAAQDSTLVVLNLTGGTEEAIGIPGRLFRRPVLSPDGAHLVAEVLSDGSLTPDLWLFTLP